MVGLENPEDAAKVEKGWNVENSLDKITRMKTRAEKKVKVRPRNVRVACEDISGWGVWRQIGTISDNAILDFASPHPHTFYTAQMST